MTSAEKSAEPAMMIRVMSPFILSFFFYLIGPYQVVVKFYKQVVKLVFQPRVADLLHEERCLYRPAHFGVFHHFVQFLGFLGKLDAGGIAWAIIGRRNRLRRTHAGLIIQNLF